jgi:hypothetical protein
MAKPCGGLTWRAAAPIPRPLRKHQIKGVEEPAHFQRTVSNDGLDVPDFFNALAQHVYLRAVQNGVARPRSRIHPYVSTQFIGDTRVTVGDVSPLYLSQSSFIAAVGLGTVPWHGITGWAEAGSAMSYITGHIVPDYRGGVNVARNFGRSLTAESSGLLAASTTVGRGDSSWSP